MWQKVLADGTFDINQGPESAASGCPFATCSIRECDCGRRFVEFMDTARCKWPRRQPDIAMMSAIYCSARL